MNPGNSAPGVVWLASDEALHVTGQVFRLVGNNLAHLPAVGDGRAVPRHRQGRQPEAVGPGRHRPHPEPLRLQQREPRHRRPATRREPWRSPSSRPFAYDESDDGVATVTLNRPDVHNAFNSLMQRELQTLWRALRRHDPVRCIVLTGAGEKAFCTGIDRMEQMGGEARRHAPIPTSSARARRRSCSTTRATTSARSRATSGSR